MKSQLLPCILLYVLSAGCASAPSPLIETSDPNSVESSSSGPGTVTTMGPTPNVNYEANAITSATAIDPEGDIAPLVPCKDGEIERRQSGKIVCISADKDRSGSTMSGR